MEQSTCVCLKAAQSCPSLREMILKFQLKGDDVHSSGRKTFDIPK